MIHIYHGNGKGKTTCGMGLCLRAAGAGKQVLIYQFMKDNRSSERAVLRSVPGITLLDGPDEIQFTSRMTNQEKASYKEYCKDMILRIGQLVSGKTYEMVFLDESLYAVHKGFIEEEELIRLTEDTGGDTEWVFTGRYPGKSLCEAADYISEIRKQKHPFDAGIRARKGIEY